MLLDVIVIVLFKQKTAYEMRISDWSSDVCSSDLIRASACSMVRMQPPQRIPGTENSLWRRPSPIARLASRVSSPEAARDAPCEAPGAAAAGRQQLMVPLRRTRP